jgi:hypothetical protein
VRTTAFAAAAVLPLAGWAVHNGLRFDDYTVARGGGTTLPFFRAFVVDRIVSPDNGPASRELARAVEQRLLTREPYRSYGITLDEFFSSGSGRMHEDFVGLSDQTWGWDDDYAHVAAAGREAIRAHPGTYARGVVRDVGILLRSPLLLGIADGNDARTGAAAPPETVVVDGRTLPKPTEDELIPAARQSGFVSTPDGRINEVWTSPTAHHIEYQDPGDVRRAAEVDRRLNAAYEVFSDRGGSTSLQRWLDHASRWYPRSILLVVIGGIALVVRRPRGWAIPAVLAGSALLLAVATMLAVYPVAEYVVPVTPAFVLLAGVGLLGRDATTPAYSRLRTASWGP